MSDALPEARLTYQWNLGADWVDLATALDIPQRSVRRFPHGQEAHHIWEWLACRDRLRELPPALDRIGRSDLGAGLIELVKTAPTPLVDLGTRWLSRWRHRRPEGRMRPVSLTLVSVGLLAVAGAAAAIVGLPPADSPAARITFPPNGYAATGGRLVVTGQMAPLEPDRQYYFATTPRLSPRSQYWLYLARRGPGDECSANVGIGPSNKQWRSEYTVLLLTLGREGAATVVRVQTADPKAYENNGMALPPDNVIVGRVDVIRTS